MQHGAKSAATPARYAVINAANIIISIEDLSHQICSDRSSLFTAMFGSSSTYEITPFLITTYVCPGNEPLCMDDDKFNTSYACETFPLTSNNIIPAPYFG